MFLVLSRQLSFNLPRKRRGPLVRLKLSNGTFSLPAVCLSRMLMDHARLTQGLDLSGQNGTILLGYLNADGSDFLWKGALISRYVALTEVFRISFP